MDYIKPKPLEKRDSSFDNIVLTPSDPTYRTYVTHLLKRNPHLANVANFLSTPAPKHLACKITALDFHEAVPRPSLRSIPDIDMLPRELEAPPLEYKKHENGRLHGRLLLIEDLTPDMIALLGATLDIDPLFFALHLHTTRRSDIATPAADDAILPSRLIAEDYLSTTYHRPVVCDPAQIPKGKIVRNMCVERKMAFVKSANVGLAQHSVSVLRTQVRDDFWLAILLADPPLDGTYYPSGHAIKTRAQPIHLTHRLFLGVQTDFLPPPKFSSDWSSASVSASLSGGGMAAEVAHYFLLRPPPSFYARHPTLESLAYYPLKIVAAEWVKYVTVMQHCIKRYEYQGDQLPGLEQFNTDLRELQIWRRRSMVSQHKVRNIIRQLRLGMGDYPDEERGKRERGRRDEMQGLIEDFEVISANIAGAGTRLENMLPVVTSLVQIIDARQSFAETTNISRLTILALIFVPLSFVASLFSMNEDNKPGGKQFWVFFVVAVPLTLMVFVVAKGPVEILQRVSAWWRAPRGRANDVKWGLKGKSEVGSEA